METDPVQQMFAKKYRSYSGRSKLKLVSIGLTVFFQFYLPAYAAVSEQANCPIGFTESLDGFNCYKIKTFEPSNQKYEGCSGNEVTIDFYKDYKFLASENGKNRFWTDYVRAYDGGPFINWRIGDAQMGDLMDKNLLDKNYENDQGACAAVDLSSGKLIPLNCEKEINRLCVIKSYTFAMVAPWNCPDEYLPFLAPVPACLRIFGSSFARRVAVRATWSQTSTLCENLTGHLPHNGYVYINHNEFSQSIGNDIPLGIVVRENIPKWLDYVDRPNTIPSKEWNFIDKDPDRPNGYVSLWKNKWIVKEDTKVVYNNVICEFFVELPIINITYVFTDSHDTLIFNISSPIKITEDIQCFSDAITYYPKRIAPIKINEITFGVPTHGDGFYWCIISNTKEYVTIESERLLFLKDKEKLKYTNAFLLQFNSSIFTTDMLTEEVILSILNLQLQPNYKYARNITRLDHEARRRHARKKLTLEDANVSSRLSEPASENFTIKGIFNDLKVLIHANHALMDAFSGSLEYEVVYSRKLLTCAASGDLPELEIGGTALLEKNCSLYTCGGTFTVGANWLSTTDESCQTFQPLTTSTDPYTTTLKTTKVTDLATTPTMKTTTEITTETAMETTTDSVTDMTTTTISATTPSREDQVNDVVNAIDNILNGPVNSSALATAVNMINDVLSFEEGVMIPAKILHSLDSLVDKMYLPENQSHISIVEPNLAIMVSDRKGDFPVTGIKVGSTSEGFNNNTIQTLTQDSIIDEQEENDVYVNIPLKIGVSSQSRISFVVFRNDRAFNPSSSNQSSERINTRVLSINMANTSVFTSGKHVDIHFRPYETHNVNETKVCAFWDFNSGPRGHWSSEGCELIKSSPAKGLDVCRCYHLTHFAQLIAKKSNDISQGNSNALTVISFVGCSLSLISLIFIYLTGILFKSWRLDFINKVWLHLSVAVGMMIVTFLCIAFIDFRLYSSVYCVISGVALHYSVLASFCWMLVAAVLSYQRLVTVFAKSVSHRLLKAGMFGWMLPALPIAVLLLVNADSYTEHFESANLQIEFCYPSGLSFWLAVFLPVILVLVCNTLLFSFIIYSVFISSKIKRHGDNKQLFRSMTVGFLLFYLFGLTWIFGLLSDYLPMAYLFCITATLQGVVLCIFFVVGNKKARDLWLVKLHLKEAKKLPVTTSISRSFPSRNSHSSRPINCRNDTDSTTKPRSLIGNKDSDSRFS